MLLYNRLVCVRMQLGILTCTDTASENDMSVETYMYQRSYYLLTYFAFPEHFHLVKVDLEGGGRAPELQ